MTSAKALVATTILLTPTLATVCHPTSSTQPNWPFSANPGSAFSCSSSAGGTNDLGSAPTSCEGSANSVRIGLNPSLGAECLLAKSDCKIPMQSFHSLDYDFSTSSCMGVWAAPLWMTPDTWQWGGGSGEIDSLEMCPRSGISLNFAGGGNQILLDPKKFSIDSTDSAHVTVRKDENGIVTIVACASGEVSDDGQCKPPMYADCSSCLSSPNFACWCTPDNPANIYGSGGCVDGTDCMWTLVSDIWNGVDGDEGYKGCMVEVPEIGLAAGQPNMNTNCSLSVENIVVRGDGDKGKMVWGAGSGESCDELTV